jgi:hypothetical protein
MKQRISSINNFKENQINETIYHVSKSLFNDKLEPAFIKLKEIYDHADNNIPIDIAELDKICTLLYDVKHGAKNYPAK